MESLHIQLLGAFHVRLDDESVTAFDSDKARALLAYLAVEANQPHRREKLAGLFWPKLPERRARANLSQVLFNLRNAIGDRESEPPIFRITPSAIQFNPESDFWLDSATFTTLFHYAETHDHASLEMCNPCIERLKEAAELYRGGFLAGFHLDGVQVFQEWCLLVSERLQRQAIIALKTLAAAYEARGQFDPALACAHRLVELDPYAEAPQRQLMRLLTAVGQHTTALAQYETHRRILLTELACEPTPETTALYEQIRTEQAEPTSSHARRHNIPAQSTPFIGRQDEMDSLDEMLHDPDTRLITIVGPGGMGKTRLAIACAQRQLEITHGDGDSHPFPDGVFFVPLASIDTADQITREIAKSLNLSSVHSETAGQARSTVDQQLFEFLSRKKMLLVLDNFEQLLDGSHMIAQILQNAPEVRILLTSRQRLQLHGGQVFPIGGLTYPRLESLEDLSGYTAIQLFMNSARRTQPNFELREENIIHLINICSMLGGMPLGVELAASWVALLSVQEISAEIQKNTDFLETDWVDLPERHHSLLAVCDTTWNMMGYSEQNVFARLSVFRGGFTLEAAQEVTKASIRDLRVLVGKSILTYNQIDRRYSIHPYLRQYGAEKLWKNPDEKLDTLDRHSAFFCDQAQQYFHARMEDESHIALEHIEADLRNIQTGWYWAIQQGSVENIDNAIDGLCLYFYWNWQNKEGLDSCQPVINMLEQKGVTYSSDVEVSGDMALSLRLYAKALRWEGHHYIYIDHQKAVESLERSMSIINNLIEKGIDSHHIKILILFSQGLRTIFSDDLQKAKDFFLESLPLSQEKGYQWMVTQILLKLGYVAWKMGAYSEAQVWFEQCLDECRTHNIHWGESRSLQGLGSVSQRLMVYDEAKHLFKQALELSMLSGNHLEALFPLESLGVQALSLGRLEESVERFQEGISISKELDMPQRARTLYMLLGIARLLRGDLTRAVSNIEEALYLSKRTGKTDQVDATIYYAKSLVLTGSYSQVSNQLKNIEILAQDLILDKRTFGRLTRIMGWVALALKNYPEACFQFIQSIEFFHLTAEHDQEAHSQAGLARAMIGRSNWEEAHHLLEEALSTAIEIQGYIPMVFALPMTLLFLAEEDIKFTARVYKQVRCDPFMGKAQLFHDLVYKHLPEEITTVPVEMVEHNPEHREALWETTRLVLAKWKKEQEEPESKN